MAEEARLEETGSGLAPVGDGWFVGNFRAAAWVTSEKFGSCSYLESEDSDFELGHTLAVLQPGQPSGPYHAESIQEDFLILAGECVLLIEGEERRLSAWDFVHCPPGTEHIFVGAGDGPCVIFMVGARASDRAVMYPRSELALRHGAGVEAETTSPKGAYAPFPYWQPGRPEGWDALPWA